MNMEDLKIILVQASLAWEETGDNLTRFERLLSQVEGPADLVLLPETFNTGYSINPGKCAESMFGPTVKFLLDAARRLDAVVMGTLLVRESCRTYNRLVCAFPDGRHEMYDKRHLFRLSEEYKVFTPGRRQRIVEIRGWKVALTVCYDLRFPVWCRNTWHDGEYGYDLLVCLANWPATRSHVWRTLLAARAMENQAFVAGVNRVGDDGYGTPHAGHSMVIDAKGRILKEAAEGEEEICAVTLCAEDLRLFRESFTVGMDWDRFEMKQ